MKVSIACLAPPLTDEKLVEYRNLINGVAKGSELRSVLDELYACVWSWWDAPLSTEKERIVGTGTDLTSGPDVRLQLLDKATQDKLWEHVPWSYELDSMKPILELIGPKDIRDCAFHLLWFAIELCNDREPLTLERIVS